jgi:hypothetical protein
MLFLVFLSASDQFTFLDAGQPYRMIGAPMFFSSLRDAVEAAEFCGFSVLADGRVIHQPTHGKPLPDGFLPVHF